MGDRIRTNVVYHPKGSKWRFGTETVQSQSHAIWETCRDVTHAGDNLPFSVLRQFTEGGQINSDNQTSTQYRTTNWRPDAFSNGGISDTSNYAGQLPWGDYALQAVNRTSPNRPYVDIGVNILELADITQLIRDQGNSLIKQLAGNNLKLQFGLLPLISDVSKIVNFHDQTVRRVVEITKLQDSNGLRRTVTLDTLSTTEKRTVFWDGGFTSVNHDFKGTRVIRGHVRWLPQADFSKMPAQELVGRARRAVQGGTLDLSTLWEGIPFSWLIDWGWNIGGFLKTTRNIIPASCDGVSLMEHTRTEVVVPQMRNGGDTMSAGKVTRIQKKRFVNVPAIPVAHFPFLSGKQMGILSSLAVMRR